jgi:hypothetical protein
MKERGEGLELDPTLPAYSLAWDAYSLSVQTRQESRQALEELRAADQPDLAQYAQGWDRHARLARLGKEMAD